MRYFFCFFQERLSFPITKQIRKAIMSATTIVGPTGVEKSIAHKIPDIAHTHEITAEQMTTPLKERTTRIAESAGNISNAEMRSEPTKFIARTMIIAVITAINRL